MPEDYTIVVPTVGRPSLTTLLRSLSEADGPAPEEIIVVDDRKYGERLALPLNRHHVRVLRSGGHGPAAARNVGWRAATTEWVVFLDDDVVPGLTWTAELLVDLAQADRAARADGGAPVGGVQGVLRVPLPEDRAPTDWERNTAGLENAAWITADMAYRRRALAAVNGFDERFTRAYREDADLALRIMDAGYRLVRGHRQVAHPVRPAGFWASVKAQHGNADDALMRRRHGRTWRDRADAGRGRLPAHAVTTAAGVTAVIGALPRIGGKRALRSSAAFDRPGHRWGASGPGVAAAVAGLLFAGMTAKFAWDRIKPGPRDRDEIVKMAVTSVIIPPVACWERIRGELAYARVRPARPRSTPAAVLFDRDGTLVRDVPYNGSPGRVVPMPGARDAVDRVRRAGVAMGVVTNQSGVARGLLTEKDVRDVHARIEELLGSFDVWEVCPHGDGDRCRCRKPGPELIERACARMDVPPWACVVIGDIGSDLAAADAAGARSVLVPTARTRDAEIAAAPRVAGGLAEAVDLALEGRA